MEINWPTILTIGSIIGTVLLVFKTLRGELFKLSSEIKQLSDKLSSFEKSTEHRLTSLEAEVKNVNQRIDSTNQRLTDIRTDMNQRLSTIEGYLIPKKIYRIEEPLKDEPKEN